MGPDFGTRSRGDYYLLIRERGAWIELDYHDHHGGDRKQTTRDHQRDRLIRKTGWKLGRYTDEEFANDREAIAADLRELFGLD